MTKYSCFQVRPSTDRCGDYDAYAWGGYIGTFKTYAEAWAEANRASSAPEPTLPNGECI
jgi:hypothetical protein